MLLWQPRTQLQKMPLRRRRCRTAMFPRKTAVPPPETQIARDFPRLAQLRPEPARRLQRAGKKRALQRHSRMKMLAAEMQADRN